MTSWEEQKREAQSAFLGASADFADVHESIGNAYRQIVASGHVYPGLGEESLTRQIAEGHFEQPEPEEADLFRAYYAYRPETEKDQDIEPGR